MSLLKRLFGGKKKTDGKTGDDVILQSSVEGAQTEYDGFIIQATPFKEAGQYQSCGLILKEINGMMHEHRFIRADRFSGIDDAVAMIHVKARQIIDEQGEEIFSSL